MTLVRGFSELDERLNTLAGIAQTAPEGAKCLAGQAVLLLREGDKKGAVTEEVLDEAAKYLNKARAALKPDDDKNLVNDIEFLTALRLAMTGNADMARLWLVMLRSLDPTNARYGEALEAVKP